MRISRLGFRKMGFSIESVAVGMLAVLFIMPLLYALFITAQRNVSYYEIREIIPMASSEVRRIFRDKESYEDLENQTITRSGILPDGMFSEDDMSQILFPYAGVVDFLPGVEPSQFYVTVTWPIQSWNTRAFCNRMSKAETGLNPNGPLGLFYEIETADCASATPTLVALYHRM